MRTLALCLLLLTSCGPVFIPAGQSTQEPSLVDGALVARDGARLPMRHWPANGEAKGVIIALHGFTDYSAAFERIGPWLAGLGYGTFAYDQRGFGAAPHPGIWPGSQALIDDLTDAIEVVRQQDGKGDLPLFIIGESMGGSVAMVTVATMQGDPPAGLILAAPGVRNELPYRPFWDALFWTAAHVAPGYTVSVSREMDLTLTEPAAKRLREDPLVIREVRADSYYGLVQLADRASRAAAEIQVPVLILHGGEDELIQRVSIRAAFELIPGDKTLRLYPGAPHLLLHWIEQEVVLDDVRHWLAEQSGG